MWYKPKTSHPYFLLSENKYTSPIAILDGKAFENPINMKFSFCTSISIFLFTWNDYYVLLIKPLIPFLESIHIQPDHFLEWQSKQNGRNEFGFIIIIYFWFLAWEFFFYFW